LTEAGRALLADARAILNHIDHAFTTTRRTARGELGRLVVGFTSSAPFHPFVPRVIRAFRDSAPDIGLTLEENGTTELIEDPRHDRVDAAFIRTHVADPAGLTVNPLLEEAMLLALHVTHALAAGGGDGPPLPLAALAGETFIVYRRHSGVLVYMTRSSPPAMPPGSARRSARRRRASSPPSTWSPPVLASRWCRHRYGECNWMEWRIVRSRIRHNRWHHCCWRPAAPTPRRWCAVSSIWSGRQHAPFRVPRRLAEDGQNSSKQVVRYPILSSPCR